jgi:hypothetical protein
VKKISTVQAFGNEIFKEQKRTIGVDLGDRWSFYYVLDQAPGFQLIWTAVNSVFGWLATKLT